VLHGLASFAAYVVIFGAVAWARMRRANITWTPEQLDSYLADPQGGVFRGNRMPFSGLPDPQARADLIAYLKQATK